MTCCVPSAAPIIWDSAFIACPGAPTASAIRSACSRYSASRFASSSWRRRPPQSPRHAASSLAASHDRSPEPSRALRSGLPLRGSQMAGHPAPVTQLVLAYRVQIGRSSSYVPLQPESRLDPPADTREAGRSPRPEYLELPRPWRLMVTAGWNLAESLGLPVAGYLVGAKLGGGGCRHGDGDSRGVADRGRAQGGDAERPRPAVGLAVLMVIESVQVFLLLTTAVTIGGVVAGTFLSALWFIRTLRRSGLRVRFTQASVAATFSPLRTPLTTDTTADSGR
jgi:hypothetical protein